MKKFAAIVFAAATAFAAPAFAKDDNITLRVDSGTVMTSTGGEFQTANTGKPVVVGERVQVGAGSAATLVYSNGCTIKLAEPTVYEVPESCTAAAAWATSGNSGMGAAIIVGAAVLGAAAIDQADDAPVGPLSTGVSHL